MAGYAFAADTITYEEPTIPPEFNTTRKEPFTIQIFCIHHQNNSIGTYEQMKIINNTANNLQILQSHTQIAPPTPPNTTVNPSKKWAKSNYPSILLHNNIHTPQLPNYQTNLPIGYSPAHVTHKDVTATQDFDLIYFALKDYRIKMTLPLTLTLTSPYNLLNSHIVTTDSPHKQ